MIVLRAKDSGLVVGRISEEELQLLVDQLEEESEDDTDYYVTMATIDLLERAGGGEHLLEMLEKAVGDEKGLEISWSRE